AANQRSVLSDKDIFGTRHAALTGSRSKHELGPVIVAPSPWRRWIDQRDICLPIRRIKVFLYSAVKNAYKALAPDKKLLSEQSNGQSYCIWCRRRAIWRPFRRLRAARIAA